MCNKIQALNVKSKIDKYRILFQPLFSTKFTSDLWLGKRSNYWIGAFWT